ncbi:hypothetical protein GE061_000320 [Apolygus lucorum]|uniref:Uncharacterized protein n=1 Tax=Apolygus lucorum TaxID=248454 RepID=A0A8S9Y496_APOLU|nr:hypothetical protein GE061_000320 [Apolygus lucorum]
MPTPKPKTFQNTKNMYSMPETKLKEIMECLGNAPESSNHLPSSHVFGYFMHCLYLYIEYDKTLSIQSNYEYY